MLFFQFSCRNGAGSIFSLTGNKYRVVGSSVPTSLAPGDGLVEAFSVYSPCPTVRVGVLALIDSGGSCGFVGLDWSQDGKLEISKEPYFNPQRPGQVYAEEGEAWIEVVIGNHRYTSNQERAGQCTHHIPDNNLLCRYLAGTAEAKEVHQAARSFERQARRMDILEGAVTRMKRELSLHEDLQEIQKPLIQKLKEARDDWERLARALAREIDIRWFKSPMALVLLKDPLLSTPAQ